MVTKGDYELEIRVKNGRILRLMRVAGFRNVSALARARGVSRQVFVRSWTSVFAVTAPRVSGSVVSAHRMSHATRADLPGPCPEAIAHCTAPSRHKPPPTAP